METNVNEVISSLRDIQNSIANKLQENTVKVCETIHQESQDRCPVDIGTMKERSGIYVDSGFDAITGYIGFLEFYAVYVHQGTGLFAIAGDGRKTPLTLAA